MPYILPAKIPVQSSLGGFQGFGAIPVPSDAVFVKASAGHHVLDPLEEHTAVRRGRDVNVVRAPAEEILNKRVAIHHL